MSKIWKPNQVIPDDFEPKMEHPETHALVKTDADVPCATVTLEQAQQHMMVCKVGQHTLRQLSELGIGVNPVISQIATGSSLLAAQSILATIGKLVQLIHDENDLGTTTEEKVKAAKVVGDLAKSLEKMNSSMQHFRSVSYMPERDKPQPAPQTVNVNIGVAQGPGFAKDEPMGPVHDA